MLSKIKRIFSALRSVDQVAVLTIFLTITLTPIFFWPLSGMPIDLFKKLFLLSGTLIVLLCFLIGRIQAGKISLPNHPVMYSAGLVLLSTLIAGLFSANERLSLLGIGLEMDTFLSLFGLVVLMLLVANYFRSRSRVLNYFFSVQTIGVVVILVQILIVLGWFWPSYFSTPASNLIGKWNSLGIYLGFLTMLPVILLDIIGRNGRKWLRYSLKASFLLGLISLVFINFNVSWFLICALTTVYVLGRFLTTRRWSGLALSLVACSIIFVVFGQGNSFLNQKISSLNTRFGVSNLEVRPSWSGTWSIVRQALVEKKEGRPAIVSTVLGVGPNHFAYEWSKYKPLGVNETMFWNMDFNAGVGLLPSMIVGSGLLGAIAWILFLGSLVIYGFRTYRESRGDETSRLLVLASYLSMIYFWGASIFYVTDLSTFALAFISTGVWFGLATGLGYLPEKEFVFGAKRNKLVFSIVLIALLLSTVVGGYYVLKHYRSLFVFRQGVYTLNQGGQIDKAQNLMVEAISLSEQDLYYRALVDLSLARMNQLVNAPNVPQDQLLSAFSQALSVATTSANRAIYLDRNNYLNYAYSGKLYEALIPLQIKGAYDWALTSYREAARVSPKNPAVYTDMARLEIINGNRKAAEGYIKQALSFKPNFSTAFTLQAKINSDRGDVAGAVDSLKRAATVDPQNVDVLFQLGSLQYKNADYGGAAATLEQAVASYPNYSNAKYFLGLAYSKLGRTEDAIKLFTEIQTLNPDSAEVKTILNNLRAGLPAIPSPAAKTDKTETKKK